MKKLLEKLNNKISYKPFEINKKKRHLLPNDNKE